MINKNKITESELIERYNNGELKGEELEKFESRMKNDPEFAIEVKLHREIDEFLRNRFEYIQKRKQLDQIYEEVIFKKRKSDTKAFILNKSLSLKWYYKLTASIVLLVGIAAILFFSLRPTRNERLYSQYFMPYEVSRTVRGNVQPSESLFDKAMDAYENNDYKTSYSLLNEVCLSDQDNTEVCFFKGISAMKIEKFDEAIASLIEANADNSSLYYEETKWYLALCYIKVYELNKARELLEKIVISDSYHKKDALNLLNDLP